MQVLHRSMARDVSLLQRVSHPMRNVGQEKCSSHRNYLLVDAHVARSITVDPTWMLRQQMTAGGIWETSESSLSFAWLVVKGNIVLTQDNVTVDASSGCVCFGPLSAGRSLVVESDAEWLSFGFRLSLYGRTDFLDHYRLPLCVFPDAVDRARLERWLLDLLAAWDDQTAAATFVRTGLAQAVFGSVFALLEREQGSRLLATGAMPEVLQLLQADPRISVSELARSTGYSPAQFRREFHRWTGQAPHAFVSSYRLAEAKQRLVSGTDLIASIALDLGFESLSHFTRLFRDTYGIPPARYRQMRHTGELER
ncbi:MAG: AraC family transcriptional regulator [Capsulimonadaceae bacterium]|nr:AraC family transcriptional regulator [Capsulimonadaceae bacterium]